MAKTGRLWYAHSLLGSFRHLLLYPYLVCTYLKFLTVGKCLNFSLVLQIQTQSFCNGRCSICPYRIVSQKLDQGVMEWNLFAKIVHECAQHTLLPIVVFELHNEPCWIRGYLIA